MIALLMGLAMSLSTMTETANMADAVIVTPAASVPGYDAINPRGRRKSIGVDRRSEDLVLPQAQREMLQANAQDIQRNYALAAWAIRCHLNYVSSFYFQANTEDQGFNTELESMVSEHDRRIDITGRHRYSKIVRLMEAMAVVRGDSGLLLIDHDDGRIQGIESDRIRQWVDPQNSTWIQGVNTDANGAPKEYAIWKRTVAGFVFERNVDARWLLMRGYYDRFDQLRGVSPLSSGLNTLRDTYENVDYALAKMKISQLFGFKVTRNGTGSFAPIELEKEQLDADGNPIPGTSKYAVDFGSGPAFLDMDPGEDAEFLNVATPTNEFREFMQAAIQLTMKCLDLPYSFFDSSQSNFFGGVGDVNHYKRACQDKIADNQAWLDLEKQWRFSLWIRDRKLKLPKGLSLERPFWEHVSHGMPWWKPTEEIAGACAAIASGHDNVIDSAKEHGKDFYYNIDMQAKAQQYAESKGVAITFTPQQQQPSQPNQDVQNSVPANGQNPKRGQKSA